MRQPLELYLSSLMPKQAEVVCALRAVILEALPGVKEDITRERIRYDLRGPVCLIRAERTHVELLFPRGAELAEGFGIPPARHLGRLKIHDPDDLWPELLRDLVQDAGELEAERPSLRAG